MCHYALIEIFLKKTTSITYTCMLSIIKPELKDASDKVLNLSESRSNGRAIVGGSTAFVYICQNVFDSHFTNLHQIKINLNPD